MKFAAFAFIVVVSFTVVEAQSGAIDLELPKKFLKGTLIKYAPHVYDVKYNGCDTVIKISHRAGASFSYSSSPFIGGGFPRDDASNFLSAGPGNQIQRDMASTRFIIRLSDLRSEDISLVPHLRGKLSTIRIVDTDSRGTLGNIRKGVVTLQKEITFAVKEKKSNVMIEAFVGLIKACRST